MGGIRIESLYDILLVSLLYTDTSSGEFGSYMTGSAVVLKILVCSLATQSLKVYNLVYPEYYY